MPKLSDTTHHLLEEPIMQLNTLCNVVEQIKRHIEPAAKRSLGIHRMLNIIVEHEIIIRINIFQ
jgi:hypothetical protein